MRDTDLYLKSVRTSQKESAEVHQLEDWSISAPSGRLPDMPTRSGASWYENSHHRPPRPAAAHTWVRPRSGRDQLALIARHLEVARHAIVVAAALTAVGVESRPRTP